MTEWRVSSFSSGSSTCVEVGGTDEAVAIRNSNRRDDGTLIVEREVFAALLDAVRADELT